MTQDTKIVLPFARLSGKHLQADFDGGTLTSDGGGLFLRETEAQIGVIGRAEDKQEHEEHPDTWLTPEDE